MLLRVRLSTQQTTSCHKLRGRELFAARTLEPVSTRRWKSPLKRPALKLVHRLETSARKSRGLPTGWAFFFGCTTGSRGHWRVIPTGKTPRQSTLSTLILSASARASLNKSRSHREPDVRSSAAPVGCTRVNLQFNERVTRAPEGPSGHRLEQPRGATSRWFPGRLRARLDSTRASLTCVGRPRHTSR